VGIVDFDDLTLAPFGYDLAKLIVSAAMTYGRLPKSTLDDCLNAYNDAAQTACDPYDVDLGCSFEDLVQYSEIHHVLTSGYLGRHGYIHTWPDARPWPAP
jgi:aminoglycoside/choline kinase family phosphotransferase